MKIASISTNGYPSNSKKYLSIFTHEQSKAFIEQNVSVEVFDLAPCLEEFSCITMEEYEGVTVHRVPRVSIFNFIRFLKTILYLRRKTLTFDVLLCSFLDSQYFKYIPFIKKNKYLAFTVHGRDAMPLGHGVKNLIKSKVKNLLFKWSNHCFVVSEYTETLLSCLVKRKSRDTQKISIVYNGINEKKFELIGGNDKNSLKKDLGFNDNDFIIISVCQLIERKGVGVIIDSILKLLEDKKCTRNLIHVIIGDGDQKKILYNKVHNSKFPHNFLFLENISDMNLAQHYFISDVYAMISKTDWESRATEGFGISYAEASFIGLPVICGKDGGGVTAVQNNFTGYWIDPNDSKVTSYICEKIIALEGDRGEYDRLSENGKLYAKREFSWEKNVSQILKVIKS